MSDFEEIYRAYFDDVYRYIRKLSGSETIADEITSETFFKAMRSLSGFRGECDVRVWLCGIAKNCYFTYLKKARALDYIDETALYEIPSGDEPAEERVARRDDAAKIREILHTLPEIYKEVFMWRVFAELDFSQIGRIFKKSGNWACVTYHRAKEMIKSRLGDETDENRMQHS